MPYYVYAIHTDSKGNCFYGSFADYHDAENQANADRKVKKIRRERGLK